MTKKSTISNKNVKEVKNKKQEVKNINNKKTTNKNSDIKKIIILIATIIVVFAVFYVVTLVLNKDSHKDIFKQEELGNAEIQYDEILVGTILKQKRDNYYVLVKMKDDKSFDNIISEYLKTTYKQKIYTVDLSSALNKNRVAEESSYEKDNMKFKTTTLLEIKDGEIETIYERSDEIKETLNDLLKEAKENTKTEE